MKSAKEIREATEQMTFNQATEYIQSLGFKMQLVEDYPFLKSWSVKNHKEFSRIANYLYVLDGDKSDVKFSFYN